jgi:hypothetical protein
VRRLPGDDPDGVRVAAGELKGSEARLQRSATPPKYDMIIKPRFTDSQVKSSLPLASRAAEEGEDGVEIDGLDQVVVKPRLLRAVSCLRLSVAGDGNQDLGPSGGTF